MDNNPAYDMAQLMYSMSAVEKFGHWDNKDLKRLTYEISTLSLTTDISQPIHEYRPNEMQRYIARFKHYNFHDLDGDGYRMLSATPDNYIIVKGVEGRFTPMSLIPVMEYYLDKMCPGSHQPQLERIQMARRVVEDKYLKERYQEELRKQK